jgi:esterase/lipase superfamily enzyme
MSVYIISNRSINRRTKKFYNKGKEKAQPTFRIAKIDDPKKDKLTYKILPDDIPDGYEKVIEQLNQPSSKTNTLKGSAAMFYDLYSDTVCFRNDSKIQNSKKVLLKNDILFFIHGFSTGFKASLNHIKKLHDLYIDNDESPVRHLVYLSWPSRNSKLFTYSGDQEDSRDTGAILARVFRKTQNFFYEAFDVAKKEHCLGRIHMMCHSMGNQVFETFMQTIAKEKYLPIITEVILLHADVQDNIFEPEEPFYYLKDICRRVHMYIHNGDDALRISRFTKNGTKRLGQRGPRNLSVLNDETFVVDVTSNRDSVSLKEGVFDHWGYLEREDEIKDIIQVLRGRSENRIETRTFDPYNRRNYYLL